VQGQNSRSAAAAIPDRQRGGERRFTVKGERTRSTILDAAERQLSERGYAGVSLRGIIEEAGVQMGQLQHYFPSKEAVFVGVIERRLPEVVAGYGAALASLELAARAGPIELRTVIRTMTAVPRDWLSGCDAGRHRYLRILGLSTLSYDQPDYVARHRSVFRPLNDAVAIWLQRLHPGATPQRVAAAYDFIELNLLGLYFGFPAMSARSSTALLFDQLEEFLVGGAERLLKGADDL